MTLCFLRISFLLLIITLRSDILYPSQFSNSTSLQKIVNSSKLRHASDNNFFSESFEVHVAITKFLYISKITLVQRGLHSGAGANPTLGIFSHFRTATLCEFRFIRSQFFLGCPPCHCVQPPPPALVYILFVFSSILPFCSNPNHSSHLLTTEIVLFLFTYELRNQFQKCSFL